MYNGEAVDFTIAGFIKYWPTVNPTAANEESVIVANLTYLQQNRLIKPYEVWIKKIPGYSDKKLYEDIKKANLNIAKIRDADQEVINMKNEPELQGSNGALSMGFIATMVITAIGFLIYWIMSIKNRTLQFGILRAMGLSSKKVIEMIICEQLLVSGVAIGAGTLIGQLNCFIFVPMLQTTMKKSEMVLPFKIVAMASDYIKLYSIIFIVLIISFIILAKFVKRMKINQAIKLGED
jgi:putative ABC transport system permease protein